MINPECGTFNKKTALVSTNLNAMGKKKVREQTRNGHCCSEKKKQQHKNTSINNNKQMQCMALNLISFQTFWRQLEKLKYTAYR